MSDRSLFSSPSVRHYQYWVGQGETLMNLEHYLEALQCFERSLELHSTDPDVLVLKGVTFIHLERYEEALTALNQALQLSPRHAEALAFRGAALNYLHRYSECYESYEQALHVNRLQESPKKSRHDRLSHFVADIYTRLMSLHTP